MIVLVGVMLSALLVPMIITQDRTTRFDSTRVQALNAAQAGIDVTVGVIRAAVTTDPTGTWGSTVKLPCGPLTGAVNGTGLAAYSVKIEYFINDPVSELDYSGSTQSPSAMKCSTGYGTFDVATSSYTPSYARITSIGTVGAAINGSSGGRTLVSTYVFQITNANIPGGVIRIFPAGSASMCMDAGSATPAENTALVLKTCSTSTPAAPQQVFAYRSDLTLQLRSSVTPATGTCQTTPPTSPTPYCGLCLNTSSTPAASGNTIRLSKCAALGSPSPSTEQWSYNNFGAYQAAQDSSYLTGILPNLCMNVANQNSGTAVTLASCNNYNSLDTAQSWVPAPSVGAGNAATAGGSAGASIPGGIQWINYFEFGRCLDVTNTSINSDHLIDYPCKQNPQRSQVLWNQKFTFTPDPLTPNSGQISTTPNLKYCLTSPGVVGGLVTMGPQVLGVVTPCGATVPASQTWTVNGGSPSLPYSTKYTVVDSAGLCLGLTPTRNGEAWSYIDVETCNGSTEQKWNASPNVLTPALQNTREITSR